MKHSPPIAINPPFKAVLFDLDGTLVEFKFDVKASRKAMIHWLAKQGFDTAEMSENTRTQSIIDAVYNQWRIREKSDMSFETIRQALSEILDQFEFKAFGEARPHAGSLQTLEALKNYGIREGIVTNSGRRPVDSILTKFGFSQYMSLVITRNEVSSLKPNPEGLIKALDMLRLNNSEVAYVGDSIIDIEAARNAGISAIAVSSGMYAHEVLARSGPDYLINDIKGIEIILSSESI